ncbi:phosphate system positive regulatory protein pho81 [Malassezia vespertilionis]|nr:phosphate system positive regulatory protein pho81 [Malassezia vespertilionis]WFD06071.1 phosphate system positive regulatory protein pho81 [Malassezia vespertilionis]
MQIEPPLAMESPASELQIHKAAFFFKLERELEKINAFYLQKESELRERLTTLITKKRHLITLATGRITPNGVRVARSVVVTRDSPSLVALFEGFRYFEKDLAKLQQFIEINATGFRKILKKWDKRSKSQTKELYLARQVDVQPCFNRVFITEMSDLAVASVLQLESLADGHELPSSTYKNETSILRGSLPMSASNLPGKILLHSMDPNMDNGVQPGDGLVFDSERRMDFEAERDSADARNNVLHEMGEQLMSAIHESRIDDANVLITESSHQFHADMHDTFGKDAAAGEASDPHAPISSGIAHMVWRALVTAPDDAVHAAIFANVPDYTFIDDVSARTTLHISALAGKLELVKACVEHGVDVRQCDVYGREPLAYAAMHGFDEVCAYLLSLPQTQTRDNANDGQGCMVDSVDLDGFSPLIHAVVRGHTNTVRILLDYTAAMGSTPRGKTESSDLSPLALAAQGGHVAISRLLLERGAKVEPNVEGLLPQTLAARAGHTECLRLLMDAGVDANAVEKGTLWTPLFYAAEFGHVDCLQLLLERGASILHEDEKQRHAVFYAAWQGWNTCTRILLAAQAHLPAGQMPATEVVHKLSPVALTPSSSEVNVELDMDLDMEADGIPSLYLPPPIIPFRTYGHNYLDKHSLVCITLSNRSIVLPKHPVPDRPEIFPGLSSSLKLVLTPRSTTGGSDSCIPHTVVLPMVDEREEITFRIEDLDHFQLECEIFPMFGSSRIAKTVLLPQVLRSAVYGTSVHLPLFDWHLNVVGHIDAMLGCVRPFGSVQLEIGGRVETYWKSTLPSKTNTAQRANTGFSVNSGGAAMVMEPPRAIPDAVGNDRDAYVTASSLSGDYLRIPVQYTNDMVPVVCATSQLPVPIWSPGVRDVKRAQFEQIARETGRAFDVSAADAQTMHLADWSAMLQHSIVTLEALLAAVPQHVGFAIEVIFETAPTSPLSLNECIDATLQAVYEAADKHHKDNRRMFFSSASPDACVALNWKQPNYAVFFIAKETLAADSAAALVPFGADPRQSSLAEAVRFAKGNNLLGIMADTDILLKVPELIPTIKSAGMVLITLSRPDSQSLGGHTQAAGLLGAPALAYKEVFDGYIQDSIVQCTK